MPRAWATPRSAIRVGAFLVMLVATGWLSCKSSLRISSVRDAGDGGGPDGVGGGSGLGGSLLGRDAASSGATGGVVGAGGPGGIPLDPSGAGGAIADASRLDTAGADPCGVLPDSLDGAAWLCGTVSASTSIQPADVLIVLDRSGSLQRSLDADCLCAAGTGSDAPNLCSDTTDCTDRWTVMKRALAQVVADTTGIHWGLMEFPSPADSTCSVSAMPRLPIAADSGAVLQAELDAIRPGGNTPMAAAIKAATAYLGSLADENTKYMLLATDGVAECTEGQGSPSGSDMEDAIAAIVAAGEAGFAVYVLGAGPDVSALDDLARAGGTGEHFPASSPDLLSGGYAAISRMVRSCSFALPAPPPDADNVVVYLDKQLVPKDPTDGWTYGMQSSTIVFNGSYCERLVSAQSTTVQVLYGCPGMIPAPCIP